MTEITSVSNSHIKNVIGISTKAKTRREQGCFVVEGQRMFFETPSDLLVEAYVTEAFFENNRDKLFAFLDCQKDFDCDRNLFLVSDQVMKNMSQTDTPQGVLGVVKMPKYEMSDILTPVYTKWNKDGSLHTGSNNRPMILVLDNVQDPGNLGTMIRTAEGAGATGILISRDTVDIFNPKVVRSTMGSLYRVPFVISDDLSSDILDLKSQGIRFFAAHLKGKNTYDKEDYTNGCGILIGNEGNGLKDEIAELADVRIIIPMEGQLESLNAAMAAGILMYEASRQRRG